MKRKNPLDNFWDVKIIAPTKRSDGTPRVIINGHDITEKLTGLTYRLETGKMPEVTLTFIPKKMTIQSLGSLQAHDVDLGPFTDWASRMKKQASEKG